MARIPEGRFCVWHNFTFLVIYEWKNNLGSWGGGGGGGGMGKNKK